MGIKKPIAIGDKYHFKTIDYDYIFTVFGSNDRNDKYNIIVQEDGVPHLFRITKKEIDQTLKSGTLTPLQT